MKKEEATDYNIEELVTMANFINETAQDDYEFEAVDQIVFEIAHRLCNLLDAPFASASDMTLVEAIEMAEQWKEETENGER